MNSIIQLINIPKVQKNISKIKIDEIRSNYCDNIYCSGNKLCNSKFRPIFICKKCGNIVCGDCTNKYSNKCVICECKRRKLNKKVCEICKDKIRYFMCHACSKIIERCNCDGMYKKYDRMSLCEDC